LSCYITSFLYCCNLVFIIGVIVGTKKMLLFGDLLSEVTSLSIEEGLWPYFLVDILITRCTFKGCISLSHAPINSFSLLTKSFFEYELLKLLLLAPLLLLLNTSAIAFLVAYELVPTLNPPYAEWLKTEAS
jgi:hypothetical protein